MANSITLFKKYIALLDEVYKVSAKTNELDGDPALVQAGANANEIIVPKIDMQGLGNYDRAKGYPNQQRGSCARGRRGSHRGTQSSNKRNG